jgi:hypothetical protein
MKPDAKGVSVFWRLGPVPTQQEQFDHHEDEWTLMKKRTSIITCGGALMGSIILRSAGFSGCVAWKKLKLNISSH